MSFPAALERDSKSPDAFALAGRDGSRRYER